MNKTSATRRESEKMAAIAILSSLLVACSVFKTHAAESVASDRDFLQANLESIKRWKDMRFGMFICWGPVSLTGHEIGWSRGKQTPIDEYDNLYKRWNPDKYDADEWVQVAKDMGARYIVFLTKHHDGFCLWDTKHTEYNVMNSALGRDVTKELADACRKEGIAFFPYYSTCDWHHPDFPGSGHAGKTLRKEHNLDRYTEYLEAQTRELISNYGPLLGIWYDVPQHFDRKRGERVIRYARSLQPNLLVNNRTGAPGDFDTPEQHVGRFNRTRPWESCITLGTQWAWKPDDRLKSWEEAVRMLVVCASGDGNLALNTNPMPDGPMEPRQVKSFRNIGKWMKKYGESIYETRGGPFIAPDMNKRGFNSARDRFNLPGGRWWGGSTHKDNTVYLHILRWPGDAIVIPDTGRKLISHKVLTGGKATIRQADNHIEVSVLAEKRDSLDTIVRLEFDKPVGDIKPFVTGRRSLAQRGKATASGIWPNPKLGPELAFDGDPATRWGGAPDTKSGWLAVDLGKPVTFDRVTIAEEPWNRVQKFRLQYKDGETWKTFHEGTTIGSFDKRVKTIHAQHIRLDIQRATDVPTIWEFQLYAPGEKEKH
jgi:alpha-L-fucosidase